MTIKWHPFGGVRLSGEDARRFVEQIESAEPNEAAARSLERGRQMMREYEQLGCVRIRARYVKPD